MAFPAFIAFQAASTLISLLGQKQQAEAAQAQVAFQAAVARNNAIIAQRAAADARLRGKTEAAETGVAAAGFVGRQVVQQAALGQQVRTGSARDLNVDAFAAFKLEELKIRNNAEREAIGFLTQAGSFTAEAQLAQFRGNAIKRALPLQLLGTLVSAAGSVSSKWKNRVQTTGGFGTTTSSSAFSFGPAFT